MLADVLCDEQGYDTFSGFVNSAAFRLLHFLLRLGSSWMGSLQCSERSPVHDSSEVFVDCTIHPLCLVYTKLLPFWDVIPASFLPVMSLFRPVANACFRRALSVSLSRSLSRPALVSQHRYYAKKATSTAEKFVPGSQQPLTDPVAQAEYAKCEEKMKAAIDWFRKDCAQGTTRATGRITPALLKDVRVDGEPLQNMATIGVRDGSILVVTVFEESVSFS